MHPEEEIVDKNWKRGNQDIVFRHVAALDLVEPRTSLLDIGCGDGLFLDLLAREKQVRGIGIDFSNTAIDLSKKYSTNPKIINFNITTGTLPFADGSFDYITALDVFEHLIFPEQLLKEMLRLTKKHIIVSVPNFSSLPARLQCLFGKVPENNTSKKGHVYWFNYDIITKMLHENGLVVKKITTNQQWEAVPVVGWSIKKLSKFFPGLFALSFVVLAEKK